MVSVTPSRTKFMFCSHQAGDFSSYCSTQALRFSRSLRSKRIVLGTFFQKNPCLFKTRASVRFVTGRRNSWMMYLHVQKRLCRHFCTNATAAFVCSSVIIALRPQLA